MFINEKDIDKQNDMGRTQLMCAVIQKDAEKAKKLLRGGARTDIEDERGLTVWEYKNLWESKELATVFEPYFDLAYETQNLPQHIFNREKLRMVASGIVLETPIECVNYETVPTKQTSRKVTIHKTNKNVITNEKINTKVNTNE